MSGPICPDCSCIAFEKIFFDRFMCKICGWKGKGLPRKILGAEKQTRISEKTRNLLKLRKEGKLCFVRVWLKGNEDERYDMIDELMEIFSINSIQGDEKLIFSLEHIPNKELIKQAKKLPLVKKITIF